MSDKRADLMRSLVLDRDFGALVGGPLPNNDEALITLAEHLYGDWRTRYKLRRIVRRQWPWVRVPHDPVDSIVNRVLWRVFPSLARVT